ncbi:MAG: OmpA family protein [Bacteroidota bacterium]|nr:OmpA family protein [Bacteroidota bacterium]
MRFTVFLILIFFISNLTYSQGKKKYEKFYIEGNAMYNIGEFDEAIKYYKKSIKINPNFCHASYKLGLTYQKIHEYNMFENIFINILGKNCSEYLDEVNYSLGEYYFYLGKYQLSIRHIEKISDSLKFVGDYKLLNSLKFSLNYKNTNHLEISRKDTLKNFVHQYSPYYEIKSQNLFYTVREGDRLFDDENLFYTPITNYSFGSSYNPLTKLNTQNNEGTLSYSSNSNFVVFTSCEMNFKKNTCDLYYSSKIDEVAWTTPMKFDDNINSEFWDSQPFIYDNRVLFFVSNRPGGKGGRDIWYSVLDDSGKWRDAKNLEKLNSTNDEIAPFVNDGILYFSSNQNNSFGGYDIYHSNNLVSLRPTIVNVGSSVNNQNDQTSIFIYEGMIFFTEESKLDQKIKSRIILGEINKINYSDNGLVSFVVKDSLTMSIIETRITLIQDNEYTIIDPLISEIASFKKSDLINSKILIEKEDYFPRIISEFEMDTVVTLLKRMKDEFILENVYFDLDSYDLNIDSKQTLDIISLWLQNNSHYKIEIGGHTDRLGSEEYNLDLSEKRALSVYNYLLSKQEELSNLSYKGYGSTIPLRKKYDGPKNRRIQFKILK